MAFLNIPLKVLQAEATSVIGTESMPWYIPSDFPVQPGNPYPTPAAKDYRWRITLTVDPQAQSSYLTRQPGVYTGIDIVVGQWIGNSVSGQAWQIISIESKTNEEVIAIVQDVYRYNTFRDNAGSGNGSPPPGPYIVFGLSDEGLPQIDPVPSAGVSSQFGVNLQSRFEYINLQYDYPLFADGNTFSINDVIAADPDNNSFALADDAHRTVVGRVTSISDIIPGWFTVNPVQKIVDFLDFLPGEVGDTIYTSTTVPGGITVLPGGSAIYVNVRKNTQSTTASTLLGPTSPGNIFQLNTVDITVGGTGIAQDVIAAVNLSTIDTGVAAVSSLLPSQVETNPPMLFYGEVVIQILPTAPTATINGVTVTFNIPSTTPGYETYSQTPQMAEAINNAAIPNITASVNGALLVLTNTNGGLITIVNVTPDDAGVFFAGAASGAGLVLNTPASTSSRIVFTAVDARAINFLDVVGSTLADFGITSVENGTKAAGLYIAEGLRQGGNTVVLDLDQRDALSPMIGDQVYVIDSDDGEGNNVGEWSMWLWDSTEWVQTSNEDSATTDAKSLEYTFTIADTSPINIGKISTGRRVTLITVEVTTPFNGTPTLNIGYQVDNPVPPAPVPDGLMAAGMIDLTVAGTYATSTDILFGTDTEQGDISVTGNFTLGGATVGAAQIIVSYV